MVEVHNNTLSELISKSESSELDFKSADLLIHANDKDRRKIARNLVGFANRHGGKLVIGVDDETRRPEGENIKQEPATETISEVSRDVCSPTVRFSHDFYSSENGDLSKGTVYVLEIEKGGNIPHAYVERSGAEIKKREYRFRAGDETRLVSDQELKTLFIEGDLDTDINEKFSTFRVNTKEYIDAYPEGLRQPGGVMESFTILQNMSQEDRDHLLGLPSKGNLHKTVAAYGFLLQFAKRFSKSWLIEVETYPGKTSWQFDDTVEMDFLEIGDIDGSEKNTPFAEIAHNPRDIMEHFIHDGFAVPSGTNVSITHDIMDSTIVIEKADVFEFEIKFVVSGYSIGPPSGHPVNLPNQSQVESAEILIYFDAKFGFPDKQDPDYEMHRQYAESIVQMLREEWDAEHFYDQLPDRILYEMDSKIDQLLAQGRSLTDPRMRPFSEAGQKENQSDDSEPE